MNNYFRTERIFLIAILTFLLCPVITFSQTTFQNFGITGSKYEYNSNWNEKVQEAFGSDYRIADWNDLKKYNEDGHDLLELFNKLGITKYNQSVFITNDGKITYSDKRSYIAIRHNRQKPLSGLIHDNIDNYTISLGSWNTNKQILVYSKSPIKYLNKEEIQVKMDQKLEAEKSETTKTVLKVLGYRLGDKELYYLLIPGLIIALLGHFWWFLESLIFRAEAFDNNIPKMSLSWGMLFGVAIGLWPNQIYTFLNNMSLNPSGKGLVIWILYIYAVFVFILFIILMVKTVRKAPKMLIIRLLLTIILSAISAASGAILMHLVILWMKKAFATIALLYFIYTLPSALAGGGPDFILKDRFGNIFKGYFTN